VNPINQEYNQRHVQDFHNQVTFILLNGAHNTLELRVVGHKRKSLLLTRDLKIQKRYSLNGLFEKRNKTMLQNTNGKHKRNNKMSGGTERSIDVRT
jgi:hypothetical protein